MRIKNGFTLMELLVSIFISGMVMMSLLAMWKTSSNHSAQAQRQSIIKNDNTIFLRRMYSDFIVSNQVICPWVFGGENPCTDYNDEYFAITNAMIEVNDPSKIIRTTGPVCDHLFLDAKTSESLYSRCLRPRYVVYVYDKANENPGIYRCTNSFLDGVNGTMSITDFLAIAHKYCEDKDNREFIMPYIENFSFTIPNINGILHPEALLLDYTVRRDFSGDIPPVFFKFKRIFVRRKGA